MLKHPFVKKWNIQVLLVIRPVILDCRYSTPEGETVPCRVEKNCVTIIETCCEALCHFCVMSAGWCWMSQVIAVWTNVSAFFCILDARPNSN
jgi:hypothetical protein